jgi:hypothetical protein
MGAPGGGDRGQALGSAIREVGGDASRRQAAPVGARRALGSRRRSSARGVALCAMLVAAPALLICALCWPMLFTGSGFNEDWLRHLWHMWNQSLTIREDHHPSIFLNTGKSVFSPEFAFYGGTLYAITGALSLAAGDTPIGAYVASYLLGFAVAFGGWYWLARMAGLGGWRAHAPSVLFVTSSYYLTLVYARGDQPEFIGVSMIPMMIASGLAVLRADRLSLTAAIALSASSIVFFGSHDLTVLWGSTLVALACALVVVFVPEARRHLRLRRRAVLCAAGLVALALLVNAWFLLPTAAYQSHTLIVSRLAYWESNMRRLMYTVSAGRLFTLSRASVFGPRTDFALSLPVLAMGWALLGIAIHWRRGLRDAWIRVALVCSGMVVLAIVIMTHAGLIVALPRPYAILQFSYRLESYVALGVAAVVLSLLAAAQSAPRRGRLWAWMLVPVMVLAIVGAVEQVGAYPHGVDRRLAIASRTASNYFTSTFPIDYTDAKLPLFVAPGQPHEVDFRPAAIRAERVSRIVHLLPHEVVYSNIGGGPEFVHVTGAKIVGVNKNGNDVLEIGPRVEGAKSAPSPRGGSKWTEAISLSAANSVPIVLGRLLSLTAVALLLGAFATFAIRRLLAAARRSRAARAG